MNLLDCLVAEELHALREGQASAELEARANAHMDECEDCRTAFYELRALPEQAPAPAPSAELAAFAIRIQARTEAYLADRSQRGIVIRFVNPSWQGTKLAADAGTEEARPSSPEDGVGIYESEELEIRVIEVSVTGGVDEAQSLALVEATLSPTSVHEFKSATDVVVTDAHERTLHPLDVRVRPLVWSGTFAGGGTFRVWVKATDTTARVEIERPR